MSVQGIGSHAVQPHFDTEELLKRASVTTPAPMTERVIPAPVVVPEWKTPAHQEIDLSTVMSEELGLDPNNVDDTLIQAIYHAHQPFEDFQRFVSKHFDSTDTICFAFINHDSENVKHVFIPASQAARKDFFAQLQTANQNDSVYVAMNAFDSTLVGQYKGRTAANVVAVRNLYTDADHDGLASVQAIQHSGLVPNDVTTILESSPGKFQTIWRVEDMPKDEAKIILQALASEFKTDPAVAEVARVLRVPGFKNLKYPEQPQVKVISTSDKTFNRSDFKLGKVEQKPVEQTAEKVTPDYIQRIVAKDGDIDAVLAVVPEIVEGGQNGGDGRNTTLIRVLGTLRNLLWSNTNILLAAERINADKFQPALPASEVKTTAASACRMKASPKGLAIIGSSEVHNALIAAIRAANPKADEEAVNRLVAQTMRAHEWSEKPKAEKTTPSVEETVNIPSSAFTSTRLSDIYVETFAPNDWPLTLALPALVTAASVIVPQMPRGEGVLIVGDDPLCTLYTALIADVHAGKTQITNWATSAIGIYPADGVLGPNYYEGKWGSPEQLLKALQKKQVSFTNKSALICPDEWSHLFSKAAIPNSSFPSTLTTAFYKRHHNFTLGGSDGGREYNLNLAMSFIGGIVEADFDTVFGAASLGGLYDRFLFGHAPEDFHWQYRPCPIVSASQWSTWGVKPVHLDESVFEETRTWDKDGQMGRIVEVCIRIATIFASVDGRQRITGKDLEPLLPLARYQQSLRAKFSPNAGVSPEAIFANKALEWVNRNALGWRSIADLKQALWRLEERLGPNVAERSLASAARGGKIDLWMAFNNTDKTSGEISYPTDYDGPKVRTGLVRRVF
jgi:DNA primase RepB-like protein